MSWKLSEVPSRLGDEFKEITPILTKRKKWNLIVKRKIKVQAPIYAASRESSLECLLSHITLTFEWVFWTGFEA